MQAYGATGTGIYHKGNVIQKDEGDETADALSGYFQLQAWTNWMGV